MNALLWKMKPKMGKSAWARQSNMILIYTISLTVIHLNLIKNRKSKA